MEYRRKTAESILSFWYLYSIPSTQTVYSNSFIFVDEKCRMCAENEKGKKKLILFFKEINNNGYNMILYIGDDSE